MKPPLIKLGPGGEYVKTTYEYPIIGLWPFPGNAKIEEAAKHCADAGTIPARLFFTDAERAVLKLLADHNPSLDFVAQFSPNMDITKAPLDAWKDFVDAVYRRCHEFTDCFGAPALVMVDQEVGRPGLLNGAARDECTRRGYQLYGAISAAVPRARIVAYRYGESQHYTGEEAPKAVISRCARLYHHGDAMNAQYLERAISEAGIVDVYVSLGCGYRYSAPQRRHVWYIGNEEWPTLVEDTKTTGELVRKYRDKIGEICTYPSVFDWRLPANIGHECWGAFMEGLTG